jgi:iron complex transport system substrate-binding protein
MMLRRTGCALLSAWLGVVAAVLAVAVRADEIRVVDDSGRTVVLAQPARRIISLAPHITELLHAAGAGSRVVGTLEFSDFPEAAKRIPRVGNNLQLDLERIVSLKPDLIVVWLRGNAQRQLDTLLHLGIPVLYSEPSRVGDVARAIELLGRVAGTEAVALPAARAFSTRAAALRARYAALPPVLVFYQIWEQPLMTVNGRHIISDVIAMCGGRNVFEGLPVLAPVISVEAVVEANPEAIVTSVTDVAATDGLDGWRKWPRLTAVARNNFFRIPDDLISRHTPRILDGAQQMCTHLESARAKRQR